MTPADAETARRLYDAFASADAAGILDTLHPDFVGRVSPGLPCDAGGVHNGPEAMFTDCWGPVFARLEIAPIPDEIVAVEDGRLLVLGHYRGRARESGRALDAVFAHVLRLRDGRIAELIQITDSQRWAEALAAA